MKLYTLNGITVQVYMDAEEAKLIAAGYKQIGGEVSTKRVVADDGTVEYFTPEAEKQQAENEKVLKHLLELETARTAELNAAQIAKEKADKKAGK